MKKILFCASLCTLLATAGYAEEVKKEKVSRQDAEISAFERTGLAESATFAPCGGYIIVRNRRGEEVYNGGYISNARSRAECSDGYLRELERITAQFSGPEYHYETDVWYNPGN